MLIYQTFSQLSRRHPVAPRVSLVALFTLAQHLAILNQA